MSDQQQEVKQNAISIDVKAEEIGTVNTILAGLGFSANITTNSDGSAKYSLSLTDEEYEKLNTAVLRYKLKTGAVQLTNMAGKAVVTATEYAVKDVAIPVAKVGATVVANGARIGVEAVAIGAGSVINVIGSQIRATSNNLSTNQEYQNAKGEVKKAFGKIGDLFGFSSSGIKINK